MVALAVWHVGTETAAVAEVVVGHPVNGKNTECFITRWTKNTNDYNDRAFLKVPNYFQL